MRKIILALMSVVAMLTAVPAQAEVNLSVIDMQRILSESLAAKDILAQMKTYREKLEKEVKKLDEVLKAEEKELIKKKETAKPEEFAAARKAFEKKLTEGRTTVQDKRKKADAAFNKAIGTLRENILTVVSTLAAENKTQLVITKQNVVIGDKALEITDAVMTRLNDKIKSIKVTVE